MPVPKRAKASAPNVAAVNVAPYSMIVSHWIRSRKFALLVILAILPLQMLSGAVTPRESMPQLVQDVMLAAPTTHYVMLAHAVLFRGAVLDVVWPQFIAIGAILFALALGRLRNAISEMT